MNELIEPAQPNQTVRDQAMVDHAMQDQTVQPEPATPERAIRVLLVDDEVMVRQYLGIILGAVKIDVVAEASDGDEVLDLVLRHRPDVVLMDIRMERMSGVEATRLLASRQGAPGVIGLTSMDTPASILDMIEAGASGYLAKSASPGEIAHAIRSVAAGAGALSPHAARVLLEKTRSASLNGAAEAQKRIKKLSEREREVVRYIMSEYSNPQIAAAMLLSEGTVKTHINSALNKTGVMGRVGLAVLATQAGLAPHPAPGE